VAGEADAKALLRPPRHGTDAELQLAPVRAGHPLGDRQTQSTVTMAATGHVKTLKRHQRLGTLVFGDAWPPVPDLQLEAILLPGGAGAGVQAVGHS